MNPVEAAPALSEDELARLPVLPLPRAVFFPGTLLPLHLFEPRYRSLIEDCMTSGPQAMAVALLEPGYEANYEGSPAYRAIAGAGRIVAHARNPDGTHDVVLAGLARVHLDEFAVDRPYRVAKAAVLRDDAAAVPSGDVLALLSCASRISEVVRRKHPEFTLGVGPADPPARIADTVADRFVADTATRQAILEELRLRRRIDLVTEALGELLAILGTGEVLS